MNSKNELVDLNESIHISVDRIRDSISLNDQKDIDILEPDEYFKKLKDSSSDIEYEYLMTSIQFILSKIEKAKLAGQDKLVQKLLFSLNSISKELQLINLGLTTFIHKSTVNEFISKVTPKNSVKIIELSRFPRLIPDEILDRVTALKGKSIFDEYAVLFTDFTDEKYSNPSEQALISRNRDPILFGMFLNDKLAFKHERMYVIGDWIDDYCDLTMEKLVSKLPELGITDTTKVIQSPQVLLDHYVSEYSELVIPSTDLLQKESSSNEVLNESLKNGLSFTERCNLIFKLLFKWK